MFCDTSVDMQSPDASMVISSADVSMRSLGIQEDLNEEDSLGMEELTRCLGELNSRPAPQPILNHTDRLILKEIEGRLSRLRAVTSIIANDQAELYTLQQQLIDIHAVATNSLSSTDCMTSANLADSDIAWLLTEWGCQSILATCVRDWSLLSLGWVDSVLYDLDAFDDKVIESMDALRGRRGDIKKSNNIFLQSQSSGSVSVDKVINAMQAVRLDEEVNLTLPKRAIFPQLDTAFPFGFLSYDQEVLNQCAKDIYTLGVNLAKGHHAATGRWV